METKKSNAVWGWAGLGLYVLTYDMYALFKNKETLSGACWRGMKHPHARFMVGTVATVTGKHLFFPSFLPGLDPFAWLASGLRARYIGK